MRVILTGGAGDLGRSLVPLLTADGARPFVFDTAFEGAPTDGVRASVLDRDALRRAVEPEPCVVVHIAAWHGIHESTDARSRSEFWDLNATGTFNVLDAACNAAQPRPVVFISSTSVRQEASFYGETKRLGEELVFWFREYRALRSIVLRPRAFISANNRAVYPTFVDWAKWYWRGAVHVDDVAQAALLATEHLATGGAAVVEPLAIDRAPDFTEAELERWNEGVIAAPLRARHPGAAEMLERLGFDIATPPRQVSINAAQAALGYAPQHGLREMLAELMEQTQREG